MGGKRAPDLLELPWEQGCAHAGARAHPVDIAVRAAAYGATTRTKNQTEVLSLSKSMTLVPGMRLKQASLPELPWFP